MTTRRRTQKNENEKKTPEEREDEQDEETTEDKNDDQDKKKKPKMTSTPTNTCNRKIRSGRLGRETNLAEKPNTKKKNEKKKTKKPFTGAQTELTCTQACHKHKAASRDTTSKTSSELQNNGSQEQRCTP